MPEPLWLVLAGLDALWLPLVLADDGLAELELWLAMLLLWLDPLWLDGECDRLRLDELELALGPLLDEEPVLWLELLELLPESDRLLLAEEELLLSLDVPRLLLGFDWLGSEPLRPRLLSESDWLALAERDGLLDEPPEETDD